MIRRVLRILILIVLFLLLAGFVGGDFGVVRVVWFGYLLEMSVPVAAALFWAVVESLRFLLRVLVAPFRGRSSLED